MVRIACALAVALTFPACSPNERAISPPLGGPARVLVFSKTAGYRHSSIADGVAAIQALGATHAFAVEATENSDAFTDANLARFGAVVFLSSTGDVLNDAQQAAFERYIQAGGGFVGVHSASDTEYDWPWYGGLVGAYFASHPAIQSATIHRTAAPHPSTASLPASFTRIDEWYNFLNQPSPAITVLITVDETSYTGGAMGSVHPVSWYHAYNGGRAWYTAMGHTSESFAEPHFLAHLAGGIVWAADLP